jgi:hypothetical protein
MKMYTGTRENKMHTWDDDDHQLTAKQISALAQADADDAQNIALSQGNF